MKSTTALRKITALRKRVRVIQGGQGAGKTIAILIILINHAFSNSDKEIIIASAELTKMRLTVIKDFVKIMKALGVWDERRFVNGTLYRCPNGSFIKFIGLDKEDIGKGLRCDVIYFNELDKISWATYTEAESRAKNVYCDYNPNAKFYAHREIIPEPDCDFLCLTFMDNEELPETERTKILRFYEKAYGKPFDINDLQPEKVISKYWANRWRVYGLGLEGRLEGVVYEHWTVIDKVPQDAKLIGIGVDWGWAKPAAVVAIWEYEGERIWDEILYGEKISNKMIGQAIKDTGLSCMTYADQAEPKSIHEVSQMGVRITGADKGPGSILSGVKKINEFPMRITARSTNIQNEADGYVWAKDRYGDPTGFPVKKDDHIMDAGRYVYAEAGKYSGNYAYGSG
ncbi:MAG: hypothetical protein GQ553_02030 [Nitrosomonadaceae bacterium]|nr:hypothetical protein [Nitrosomonadaceae bacterium]